MDDNVLNNQREDIGRSTEAEETRQGNAAGRNSAAIDDAATSGLREKVIDAIRTCYDPEIPVNIYELGLVYEVKVEPSAEVAVKMTLTSPACPAAISLPGEVEDKIRVMPGVKDVKVEVVWDPPWDPSKMSEAARLELGMM
jgi:FeS assembly SUF system protein